MNKETFSKLRAGDRVESLKSENSLTVKEINGDFMKDSNDMIWYRGNLKDRVFLAVSRRSYVFLRTIDLEGFLFQRNHDINKIPEELNSLYALNKKGLFDAILHESYFVKED